MNYKKYVMIYLFIVFGIIAVAFSASYALQYISDTTINKVSTSSLSVDIVEIYNPPKEIYPGQEIEKVVNVKNTGNIDALVRVRFEKAWGDSRDSEGNLNIVSLLSTDNIIIELNTEYWVYSNGYYYYKGILQPNETTFEPLFTSFKIDPSTGNEYQGMLGDIIVYTEVIQAGNGVIEDAWGKTYEFIGVEAPKDNTDYRNTKVTFISPEQQFNIHTTKIDLFTNFKDLIPGSTKTQIIEVCNDFSQNQPIYLKANITSLDESKRELIEKMLQEYIFITITKPSTNTDNKDENKPSDELIYEGAVYGNLLIDEELEELTNNMKYFVLLGDFEPKSCVELVVSLSVDKTMGNEYKSLLGNIEWEFLTSYEPPKNPYTGDNTLNYIIMGTAGLAIAITSAVFLIKINKKKEEVIESI